MERIIIYSHKRCPYTKKLINLLNEREIEFDFLDIERNSSAREKVYKHRYGHVPVPQVELRGKLIHEYGTEERLVDMIEKTIKSE